MSVTRPRITEKEQYFSQIERLVHSHVLHGSEQLCKLLRYLGEHALEKPGSPLKEYQIATEVFGRPADFDPQLDSTIRVQAGRLRLKLAEYYSTEGTNDPVIVELPKGTYLPSFHLRSSGSLVALPRPPLAAPAKKILNAVAVLSALLFVAIAIIIYLITTRNSRTVVKPELTPAVFSKFWKGYLNGPEEPWVIFSNGAFVGRPETGMRYFDSAHDSRDAILDHYTGVGEVLAVHSLDQVFTSLNRRLRVKRGSLVSLDDVKNADVIFVGSPAENLTLRDIPSTRRFFFRILDSGPRKGDLAIMNVQPQAGEPNYFIGTPSNLHLQEDYSIIARVPGMNPAKSEMILAGTTTLGTEAAVEYVCQQDSLEKLLPRLRTASDGTLEPFEAVLRTRVRRGVPVESEIVALRNGR
jgi:hypothetical protein